MSLSAQQGKGSHPGTYLLHGSIPALPHSTLPAQEQPDTKWEMKQEPYLSFLLSAALLESIKPPSSTPFPKLRIPNQRQSAASFLMPVQSPWLSVL